MPNTRQQLFSNKKAFLSEGSLEFLILVIVCKFSTSLLAIFNFNKVKILHGCPDEQRK